MILVYIFVAYLIVATIIYAYGYVTSGYRIQNTNADQRQWYGKIFIAAFAVMILLLGLRNERIGIDTWNYADHFERCRTMLNLNEFIDYLKERDFREGGYWLCVFLLTRFGLADWGIRFVFAILSCVPVGVYIYKKSNSFLMSLFIYFAFGQFAFNFSGIRQGLAIGFVVLSMIWVEEKPCKALLAVLCASLFHTTAIVFIPAIFLSRSRVNALSLLFFTACTAMLLVGRDWLMEMFKEGLSKSYDGIRVGGTTFMLFLIATAILQYYYFYGKIHAQRCTESVLFWLSAATAVVYVFARTSPVYLRLALYYQIALVVSIPNMLRQVKDNLQRFVGYWGYVVVGVYFFIEQVCFYYQITPYYFFWQ